MESIPPQRDYAINQRMLTWALLKGIFTVSSSTPVVCTIEDFAVKLLTPLVLVMLHASHNGQASGFMHSYMLVIGV